MSQVGGWGVVQVERVAEVAEVAAVHCIQDDARQCWGAGAAAG